MLECPSCPGGPTNSNCNGQEALTFDPSYQYPYKPMCGSPDVTECPVQCDTSLPEYQCCSWYDCCSWDGCSLWPCENFECAPVTLASTTTSETTTTTSTSTTTTITTTTALALKGKRRGIRKHHCCFAIHECFHELL